MTLNKFISDMQWSLSMDLYCNYLDEAINFYVFFESIDFKTFQALDELDMLITESHNYEFRN